MGQWKASCVAPALLFERLVDNDLNTDSESHPLRALTRQQFKKSVIEQVVRVLSTRSSASAYHLLQRQRSVLDYGIPNISSTHLDSPTDKDLLLLVIRDTIAEYEPRLHHVDVKLHKENYLSQELLIEVQGDLEMDEIMEPLSFPVTLPLTSSHS